MHAAASSADSASAIENVHSLLSSRGVEARATEKNDDSGNHFISQFFLLSSPAIISNYEEVLIAIAISYL